MGRPLQMSQLSPGREGRKTLRDMRGVGLAVGQPLYLLFMLFLRRNRSVFRDKLLYAFVWLFFLAHPVGEKTNLLLDTTDP